jgi:isoleucyl-tRNA synthetase
MYRPVPRELDFPALEHRILRFWDETHAFETLRRQLASAPRRFSFIDGPITANNPMGVHHAWGRTYKDLYQRYKAMTGHRQRYQNGFDCQGLWVEVEVERELGFQTKRDIERYGVAEFVRRCKERVLKYARVQTEQSIRLGYWMDWSDSYYTMSDENNYTIWQMLKVCRQRGWLYRGHDVMPWCPRCSTGLSQMEIDTEGYQEVTHPSLYVKLPLVDRPGAALLVWTTTPWTLPANVAAAVHPELTYAFATKDGQTVVLAEPLVRKVLGPGWDVARLERGAELVGLRYSGPFDELPAARGVEHRVIPWDEVSQDEGTGIVHIAPGCGEEDYRLGKEFGLPAIAPIDDGGVYVDGFGPLTGQHVQQVAQAITDDLRRTGRLLRAEPYTHRYPHCWRCRTELVFRLVDEWYINVDELRPMLMAITRQIRWLPEFGLERELDWLRNMHDWMISKKRYWGLALPIWVCEACQHFDVIGGKEELAERAVAGWDVFEGHTPHRPWVDAVTLRCGECGGTMTRTPDVGNPWLDAGIVPYSTLGYRRGRVPTRATRKRLPAWDPSPEWREWFPADFISESFPGQYRNWFYSMLVMSAVLENTPPYLTVLGYGTLRGEDGQPMHKSLGNAIDFNEAAERSGADVMRWIFVQQNPAAPGLNFGWKGAEDAKRRLLQLWNSYYFFVLYARPEGWVPGRADTPPAAERPLLDRWLLAELQALIARVRERLEDYDAMAAARAIETFFDDLSNWYIRRSRDRFWAPGSHPDPAALATLHEALVTLAKLLAPMLPFLAEELYQNLVRSVDASAPESVHHCAFPEVRPELRDDALRAQMERVRLVASLGHAARKQAAIPVRRPLPAVRVAAGPDYRELPEPLLAELAGELNVKRVEFPASLREAVRRRVETNPKLLGAKYRTDYPRIRAALQAGDFEPVGDGRVRVLLPDRPIELEPDEATVVLEPAPGYAAAVDGAVLVVLDTTQTPELIAEGRARELVRLIQEARKAAGFDVSDRIVVGLVVAAELQSAVDAHADYIRRETLATALEPLTESPGWSHTTEGEIDGLSVVVAVRKCAA